MSFDEQLHSFPCYIPRTGKPGSSGNPYGVIYMLNIENFQNFHILTNLCFFLNLFHFSHLLGMQHFYLLFLEDQSCGTSFHMFGGIWMSFFVKFLKCVCVCVLTDQFPSKLISKIFFLLCLRFHFHVTMIKTLRFFFLKINQKGSFAFDKLPIFSTFPKCY